MGKKNTDENIKKKKRKKRTSVKLYQFFSTLLGIVIIVLGAYVLFNIQSVKVEGNSYTDETVIKETVQEGTFSDNALYLWAKYKIGKGKKIKSCSDIKVTMTKPWILKIKVKEKEIVGYYEDEQGVVCFDKEGMVVYTGSKVPENAPKIEGLHLENLSLYDTLDAEDKDIFKEILKTTKIIKKYDIDTEKVVYLDSSIYLIKGEVHISLGKNVSNEQIAQIPPILEKLGTEETGTLYLNNYSENRKTITFKKGEFPPEE